MARRNLGERGLYVAAAAYLMARNWGVKQKDGTQKQIADELGVSQGEVSRLLADARNDGWLVTTPKFVYADQEVWRAAEQRFFSSARTLERLRQLFPTGGRLLNRITQIHLADGRIDPISARIARRLLGHARLVGVTWGYSVSRLVEAMADLDDEEPPRPAARRIQFVPLCGEPLWEGAHPSVFSSSVLADKLSRLFNGEHAAELAPSIAGVQAFIPLEFADGDVKTIRRFISRVRGYADVFGAAGQPAGGGSPLADQLDAVLTSVGTVERQERGIFLTERIDSGDISEDELERISAGDVGGIIIPAAGISRAEEARVTALNERWTGVRLDHLQRCATAAWQAGFKPEKPGVAMLALGARRRKIVARCVELGLVSELILDRDLEYALA